MLLCPLLKQRHQLPFEVDELLEGFEDLCIGHRQLIMPAHWHVPVASHLIGDCRQPGSNLPVLLRQPLVGIIFLLGVVILQIGWNITALCFNDDFESSVCHALNIEGHRFVLIFGIIHHRVFHHFSIHLITMRA